jgi:hypothetical protein
MLKFDPMERITVGKFSKTLSKKITHILCHTILDEALDMPFFKDLPEHQHIHKTIMSKSKFEQFRSFWFEYFYYIVTLEVVYLFIHFKVLKKDFKSLFY